MSNYAYESASKIPESRILAEEAITKDRSTRYYCPGASCNAELYLKVVNGSSKAYFSTLRGHKKHIENCAFSAKNRSAAKKIKEEGFSKENYFRALMEPVSKLSSKEGEKYTRNRKIKKGKIKNKNLCTLAQGYSTFRSLAPNAQFNGFIVGDMLINRNSEIRHLNGIYGLCMVEANVCKSGKIYDKFTEEIFLEFAGEINRYALRLFFQDSSLYKRIRDEIYHNQTRRYLILGDWEWNQKEGYAATKVQSAKQVYIIPKKYL